MKPKDGENET